MSSFQFGGNPVSMAIADAVLSVIEEEGLCDHAEKMGSFLLQELEGLKEKHMCIGDVRGEGLFIGLDLVIDRETREPDKELTKQVEKRWENDLIASPIFPIVFINTQKQTFT